MKQNRGSDSLMFSLQIIKFVCVSQTGEPGCETEGMGAQESAGERGAAWLLHGALSRPGAETGPQSQQQQPGRC